MKPEHLFLNLEDIEIKQIFPVLSNSLEINLPYLKVLINTMQCFGFGYALKIKPFSGK